MTDGHLDLVVVGGGVLGLTTAVIAKLDNPEWAIKVVERDQVGRGATGYTAGLSFPVARDTWQASLVRDGEAGYRRLVAELPDLPVRDIEVLWAVDRNRLPEFTSRLVGAPPRPASEAEIDALRDAYPDFKIRSDEEVMTTDERCFHVDGRGFAQRLARWLRAADPGSILEGVEAARTRRQDDGWDVVLGDGGVLRAPRVVVAVGPWRSEGLEPGSAGVPPIRVKKVAALHLAHRPRPGAPALVLWDDDAFVLPLEEQGFSLFSYTNLTWDVDPDRRLALTADETADAIAVLEPRSRTLAASLAGSRVFCDGYTEDRVPSLRYADGLVAIGGCSGSGVRLAPGLAVAALERLLNESDDRAGSPEPVAHEKGTEDDK